MLTVIWNCNISLQKTGSGQSSTGPPVSWQTIVTPLMTWSTRRCISISSSSGNHSSTSSTSSCPALSSPHWLFWPFFYLQKVFACADILRLMYSMPQNIKILQCWYSLCLSFPFCTLSVSVHCLSFFLSFSWRAEVDRVHFCTVGSDCVSLPNCSEDSRNVTFRASYWQVSVSV